MVVAAVVVGAAPVAAAVVVVTVAAAVVVVSIKPPVMVGIAYGGSKRPNRPQALQGQAQDLTSLGAARMGSHRESVSVAMAVGSTDWGQSVPRSFSVSCSVAVPPTIVETSSRSRAKIFEVADGPTMP